MSGLKDHQLWSLRSGMKKITSKKIAFYILLSLTFLTGTEGKKISEVIGPYEQEKPVQR